MSSCYSPKYPETLVTNPPALEEAPEWLQGPCRGDPLRRKPPALDRSSFSTTGYGSTGDGAIRTSLLTDLRALERMLREQFGLPLADYEVLARLAEVPEGERVRMQELARKVLLSKSGLSQLFTKLERRGLVERRGDPDNLRVTYVTITAEGREALERAQPRLAPLSSSPFRVSEKASYETVRKVPTGSEL